MPIELDGNINQEKNQLDTVNVWLWLLKLVLSATETLYFVNNPVAIPYGGQEYTPLDFQLGDWNSSEKNNLPSRAITISNRSLVNVIYSHVKDYSGLIGKMVTITPVNSGFLSADMTNMSQEFEIITTSLRGEGIGFNLGAPNPLTSTFPKDKYMANYCRYVALYKEGLCGATSELPSCDGTPKNCEERNNLARIGCFPGLRPGTVRFA